MNLILDNFLAKEAKFQVFDLPNLVVCDQNALVIYGKWDAERLKDTIEKGNRVIQILQKGDTDMDLKSIEIERSHDHMDDMNYPDLELLKNPRVTVICDSYYKEVYVGLLKYKSPEELMMSPSADTINSFVILLMRDLNRVSHVHQKLTTSMTGLRIFPAIDALTPHAIDNFVRLHKLPIVKPIRAGRIGCFFSHYNLWSDLLASKSKPAMMILEDDNIPIEGFTEKFDQVLKELPPTFDILHLYLLPDDLLKLADYEDNGRYNLIVKGLASTQTCAYLISRKGTRRLCEVVKSIKDPLDLIIKKHVETGYLEGYAVKTRLFENLGVEEKKGGEQTENQQVLKSNTQESQMYMPNK
jgi:GR25 family glycosyltransferase involved in LPS biosynthesis